MQKNRNIILPLSVGLQAVRSNCNRQIVSTSEMEIQMVFPCKVIKSLYCSSVSRVSVVDKRYQNDRIVVECAQGSGRGESDFQLMINSHAKEHKMILPPFTVSFCKEGDDLSLCLARQITSFVLYPAGKSRFVKNEQLSRVIENRGQKWGPLSMDKSQRMMLQPKDTAFPVIGLWISTSHPISHCANMARILQYLNEKSTKKCTFTLAGRSFFYLVVIDTEKSVPQLFVVQFKDEGQTEKHISINKKQVFTMGEVTLCSDERTAMEFTLRSDQKVPQPLLNITCSPIKFPTMSSPQQTTKSSLPDSPRFKLDHSAFLQEQCASLRRLTSRQAIQINDLKAEILRLSSQLRQCLRQRQCSDSREMSLSSVGERGEQRRMTKSDLNYDSPSIANEEVSPRKEKLLQAWECFQIQQPKECNN